MSHTTIQYTAKTHTAGGRRGTARSDDGHLEVRLSVPGTRHKGTNPEQLLAAAWSASFLGALRQAARARRVRLAAEPGIDAEVDRCSRDGEYFLQVRLTVGMPGLEREVAWSLVEAAHQICPCSKAMRGNLSVTLIVA